MVLAVEAMSETETRREWWVVSTVLVPPTLMLKDRVTGVVGFAIPETREDWRRAYSAPSAPYRYEGDPGRVSMAAPKP
jgi:hypothetical protein